MQLLNTTVSSMALTVNKVLTASYHACYENTTDGDELVLVTAPLTATTEVEALYTTGLIDIESALPAVLHSLGCSAVEIEGALKRRRDADASGADSRLLEAQNVAKLGDADAALKAAQTQKTQAEIEGVRAGVGKIKAETKKLSTEASTAKLAPSTRPVLSNMQ